MLVDNIRTAHSREPYEGPREILVGMAEPVTPFRRVAYQCDGLMTTNLRDRARRARQLTVPPFAVISGGQVQGVLGGQEKEIVELVEATYRLHGAGDSVNPPSYFLRSRTAHVADYRVAGLHRRTNPVDGLKVDFQFPGECGGWGAAASAVLILNDHDTGYPFACLEASIISATRTAASAALAADWLSRRPRPTWVGFVGAGLIARYIHTFLAGTGWSFDEVGVHDLSTSSGGFRGYLEQSDTTGRVRV